MGSLSLMSLSFDTSSAGKFQKIDEKFLKSFNNGV